MVVRRRAEVKVMVEGRRAEEEGKGEEGEGIEGEGIEGEVSGGGRKKEAKLGGFGGREEMGYSVGDVGW